MQAVQEKNPLGGGRGGFGWAQWTGPRRVAFEQYAKENSLDPKSDEANYGFLRKELQGSENAKMMEQLKTLKGPDAARQAAALVERMYERPAVSNAGVRGRYAERMAAAAPVAAAPPVPGGAGEADQWRGRCLDHPRDPPPNAAVTATGSGSVNVCRSASSTRTWRRYERRLRRSRRAIGGVNRLVPARGQSGQRCRPPGPELRRLAWRR